MEIVSMSLYLIMLRRIIRNEFDVFGLLVFVN
jgi:hypothetical protein